MKKVLMLLFILVLMSAPVMAETFADFQPVNTFYDLTLSTPDGLKINNFNLAEDRAFMSPDLKNIIVSCSATNRGDRSRHFDVMLVGIDKDNNLLWATSISPMMNTLQAGRTDSLKKSVYVPAGSLKRTSIVFVKVVYD